jgi:hypothetical protein
MTKRNYDIWEDIKKYYWDNFKIPNYVLDYISIFEIIKGCACGISNKNLSETFDFSEKEISDILINYLDFPGWNYDTEINLYNVFLSAINFEKYKDYIIKITDKLCIDDILKSYKICEKVSNIERIINEYYI